MTEKYRAHYLKFQAINELEKVEADIKDFQSF